MPIKMFTMAVGRATARLGEATALALPAVLVTIASVDAGSVNGSCVGTGRMVNCAAQWNGGGGSFPLIVKVPRPATDQETAEAEARVRQWEDYCQPVIRYDRYGVGRYVYRVSGCEFGRRQD